MPMPFAACLSKTFGLFSFCLLAALVVGCQGDLPVNLETEKSPELEVVGDPPKAVVEEGVHEFGSMEVEQTLSHEFLIRNEGKGVLKLKKDRSTCKCTMADFDEAEVAPGESTKIRLEWIGKVLDPAFSQSAFIKTNDPDNPELELRVSGRVDQTYDISPAGVWNLGEMSSKQPTEFTGTISSRVLENFAIKEVQSDNPLITVKTEPMPAEELEEQGFKGGYKILGEVAPGAPIGQFKEQVSLSVEHEGEVKTSVFNIEGYYSGPMQIIGPAGWVASDMLLVMGRFPASEGKKVQLSLFLRDNPGEPLEVTKVTCVPDHFRVELKKDDKFQAENRERYNLTIEVPPGAPSLVHEKLNPAKITIETNNPLVNKMAIQVNLISY